MKQCEPPTKRNGGSIQQHTPLEQALKTHFHWETRRLDFLARFILALIQKQTINLAKIARALNLNVHPDSNQTRCARFIREFEIDLEQIATFLIQGLPARFDLLLDRTEHFFGKTSVNVLTFAAGVGQIRQPLIWEHLGKTGSSDTSERKNLLKRLLKVLDPKRIQVLIADREFIGIRWLAWLKNKRIPFAIRIRANTIIRIGPFKDHASRIFLRLKVGEVLNFRDCCVLMGVRGYISATRLETQELLIVFRSHQKLNGLEVYARRWGIECLFKSFRTAGFNLSDSHVTQPERVARLFVLLTLALTWAVRIGLVASRLEPIVVKSHGRAEFSVFRFGLDVLSEILLGGTRLMSFLQAVMVLFDTSVSHLRPCYTRIPLSKSG